MYDLVADPLEPINRPIYAFNDTLDRFILTPAVKTYRFIVPAFGRDRIRDFIDNVKTPIWFANETLQGDWNGAQTQLSRFALNTTVGVLGFYDFAENNVGLNKVDEDFGQTLGVWGVPEGPYLVLPVLGPSTARDAIGRVGDFYLDPLTYANGEDVLEFRVSHAIADNVDIRERLQGALDITRDSVDPYIQARTIYIQARRARTFEFEDENRFESLPDFDDDFEEDFDDDVDDELGDLNGRDDQRAPNSDETGDN